MSSESACFLNALAHVAEVPRSARGSVRVNSPKSDERGKGVRSEATDEMLLKELREGANEALGILFRRYAHMVRNVAYRILRSEAEADDLVQEVFLFVFRKAGLFDPPRLREWLLQSSPVSRRFEDG